MNITNRVKSTISSFTNIIPSLRKPEYSSLLEQYFREYKWALPDHDKSISLLQTYYDAYHYNVWVRRCCGVYCDELLNNGFNINNPYNDYVNFGRVNYLNNLFRHPGGLYDEATFSSLVKQILPSWKITGDAFIEVNHDRVFNRVPNGFKFIPTELIGWDQETSQWGIRNTKIRYEPEQLIHIYEPKIELKGSRWGTSLIDSISADITLEILGKDHNKDIFKNSGLDPRGIITFDKDLGQVAVEANRKRLREEKNKKGTLILQAANYLRTSNSNRDMEFLDLMKYSRDVILVNFGVPPHKVDIIETASLGSGTGESQNKDFQKVLNGTARVIEDQFNKSLGRSGFSEVFTFNREDAENKLNRAEIEDKQLRNGSTYINEVRSNYGLDPVDWGNVPMNYSQFALAPTIDNVEDAKLINPKVDLEAKALKKALLMERLGKEYNL
ncbi:MAG: phage portal protein [Methanobrevibacter sp.]|nr:phage portal protein [Methanobrevibacter sp.]MBQ9024874.1 phage portal protein [Methanobrevibacter sp.]